MKRYCLHIYEYVCSKTANILVLFCLILYIFSVRAVPCYIYNIYILKKRGGSYLIV